MTMTPTLAMLVILMIEAPVLLFPAVFHRTKSCNGGRLVNRLSPDKLLHGGDHFEDIDKDARR
jgi:hypothetical protein